MVIFGCFPFDCCGLSVIGSMWYHCISVADFQGSKLMVTSVQNVTDLRLFAPKLDLGATLLLKFLKLILAWHSKSLISFLVVNLCLNCFSLEA